MHFRGFILALAALVHTSASRAILPEIKHIVPRQAPTTQQPTGGAPSAQTPREQRAQAVIDAFSFAYGEYQAVFPADQIAPVTGAPSNPRNGWGASAIDGLDTAIIMNLGDIVTSILQYVPTINYGVSYQNSQVSLFETTIRYIGGMLSAYDLLNTDEFSHLATDRSLVDALLTQSAALANNLSFAFETPTGVPSNNLYFNNRSTDGSQLAGLAQVGTLVLEWTRLTDLTGNQTYTNLAQKGQSYLLAPTPPTSEPFPGLPGMNLYISNGSFADAFGGWIGGSDSFFEYLIKMYLYDPQRFGNYRDRWTAAADSSIQNLASHPQSRPDLTFLAEYNGTQIIEESGHLACFDGGNFILGGQVLGNQQYIDFGISLVEACHETYDKTASHVGPEIFDWDGGSVPSEQQAFYQQNGFYISNADYDLRPEVIESYYYAYEVTGDQKYQDWAWDAFVAIYTITKAEHGFSEVSDVNNPTGGNKEDNEESFLFAELLKYAYLIQAPHADYDVANGANGKNTWVFNTEAHPFKIFSNTAGTPPGQGPGQGGPSSGPGNGGPGTPTPSPTTAPYPGSSAPGAGSSAGQQGPGTTTCSTAGGPPVVAAAATSAPDPYKQDLKPNDYPAMRRL